MRESIIPAPSTVANAYIEFDGPLNVVKKQLMRGAFQHKIYNFVPHYGT